MQIFNKSKKEETKEDIPSEVVQLREAVLRAIWTLDEMRAYSKTPVAACPDN